MSGERVYITAAMVPWDGGKPAFEIEMLAEDPRRVELFLRDYAAEHDADCPRAGVRYEDGTRFFNRRSFREAEKRT